MNVCRASTTGAIGPADNSWSVPGSSTIVAPAMSAAALLEVLQRHRAIAAPVRDQGRDGDRREDVADIQRHLDLDHRAERPRRRALCNLAIHATCSGVSSAWLDIADLVQGRLRRTEMRCRPFEKGLPFLQESAGQVRPHRVGHEAPDMVGVRCGIEAGNSAALADPRRMGRVTPAASMTAPRSSTST